MIFPTFNGVPIVVSRDKHTDIKGPVLDLQHLHNTINAIAANTGNYPTELLVSPEQYDQIRNLFSEMTGSTNIKVGDWVLIKDRIFEVTRLHPLAGKNIENRDHRGISITKAIKVPKGGNPDYIRTLYGQPSD